jgi:hypothetical protein
MSTIKSLKHPSAFVGYLAPEKIMFFGKIVIPLL